MINKVIKKVKSSVKKSIYFFGKKTRIGNFVLNVDPENSQPYILKKYPEHGTHLVRLANILNTKYNPIKIIDIGANFGDTAAMLLTDNQSYEIICIEGDKTTFKLLSDNFKFNKQTYLYNIFLGEKDEILSVSSNKIGGSLRLNDDKNSINKINIITLDSFINSNPEYLATKLLKIDTDGYDNRIMRGSKEYLKKTRPAIFFEYDKKYLQENQEDGLTILDFLKQLGYSDMLFYDNVGRFILSVKITDVGIIKQLDRYITDRKGLCAYYDIVAFHSIDSDIATAFIKEEGSR